MEGSSCSSNHAAAETSAEEMQPDTTSVDLENSAEPLSNDDNEVATAMSSAQPSSVAVLINANARSGVGAFQPLLPRRNHASVSIRKSDVKLFYEYEVLLSWPEDIKLKANITRHIAQSLNITFTQLGEKVRLYSHTHLKDIDGMPLQDNTSIRFLVEAKKYFQNGGIEKLETIALVRLKKTHEYTCHALNFSDGRDDTKGSEMKREKDQQRMERRSGILMNRTGLIFVATFVITLIAIGFEVLFQNYVY